MGVIQKGSTSEGLPSRNESETENQTNLIIFVGTSVGLAVLLIALGLFVVYRCKKPSSPPSNTRHVRKGSSLSAYTSRFPTIPINQSTPPSGDHTFTVDGDHASTVHLQPPRYGTYPHRHPKPRPSHLNTTSPVRPGSRSSSWSGYPSEVTEESETDGDNGKCDETPRGKVWLEVYYNKEVGQLTVNLIKAKYYLTGSTRRSFPREPFLRLYLLPDESHYLTSQPHGRSLSPKFDETFKFQVPEPNLTERTIRISVYDLDKRKVRRTLGHSLFPLSDLNLTTGEVVSKELVSSPSVNVCGGNLQVGLCYVPVGHRIHLSVMGARKLLLYKTTPPDSYVKIQFYDGNRLLKSKKTSIVRSSDEPIFNETFSFNTSGHLIETLSLTIILVTSFPTSVLSSYKLSTEEATAKGSEPSTSAAGGSTFNNKKSYWKATVGPFMYARGHQLHHWQEMISHPKQTITKWHHLIPF